MVCFILTCDSVCVVDGLPCILELISSVLLKPRQFLPLPAKSHETTIRINTHIKNIDLFGTKMWYNMVWFRMIWLIHSKENMVYSIYYPLLWQQDIFRVSVVSNHGLYWTLESNSWEMDIYSHICKGKDILKSSLRTQICYISLGRGLSWIIVLMGIKNEYLRSLLSC